MMIGGISVLCAICIMLFALLLRQRARVIESGILSNPPTFIEVLENKPILIRVDKKYVFKVRHPSAIVTIQYLSRLRQMFSLLKSVQAGEYTAKVEKAIQGIYISIAYILYAMSKDEYRNPFDRMGYRRALVMRCITSTEWMTELVSQINDFYKLLKKKESYQAAGGTLRQINGEGFTWDTWKRVSRFTN